MGLTFSTDYRYVCSTCIQNCGGLYQIKEKAHHSKIQKMTVQNTFPIMLLYDGNILEQHLKTKMQMVYGFEKIHFLYSIDLNPELGICYWKYFVLSRTQFLTES